MEAFSLLEVNQYIKRVLALNFEEAFWVECEINQVSHSKGNVYLELIEKDEDSDAVLAKNSAQIWYRQHSFIKRKLGKLSDAILSAGIKVKMKVNISYSERYGLSLIVEDIDPAYTFGQFEMNRQKIIEQLKQKDLIDRNAETSLPTVIQRIAVISSSRAAGYQDFIEQLQSNSYGYAFAVELFDCSMQGQKTERDVVEAIQSARKTKCDVIVIVRGGGSKLDLSSFDNYNIAFEIAASGIPVFTGIGHDIDQTVTDIVAHTVLKTPTAVAEKIIEHNVLFESEIIGLEDAIMNEMRSLLSFHTEQLDIIEARLSSIPQTALSLNLQMLENLEESLAVTANSILSRQEMELEMMAERLLFLNPEKVLKRGYTLVKRQGKIVSDTASLKTKEEDLEIQFRDGSINVKKQ